jgi:hypothetical protein
MIVAIMFIFVGPILYALVFLLVLGFIKLVLYTFIKLLYTLRKWLYALRKWLKLFLLIAAFIIMIVVPITKIVVVPITKIVEQLPFELLFIFRFFVLITITLSLSGLHVDPHDKHKFD